MSDRDSDHMLLELQEARAEIDRLRELLRWRDAKTEKPEQDSLVLVNLIERFAGRIPVRVMRYSERCEWIDPNAGIWMDRDVQYWRPIGPLPGGE